MAIPAKVIAMSARPWKASLLCFEVGGILGQLGAQLGDTVTAFDFTTFYAGLGATVLGDASLLKFDSQNILAAAPVTASMLATLRAEGRKSALDRAVSLRQNAYYSKYSNIASVVTMANNLYGAGATAKPARLQNLSTLAQKQADDLALAYTNDGRTGVIKNTNSSLNSKTTTTDAAVSSGKSSSTTQTSGTTSSSSQQNLETIGGQHFDKAGLGSSDFPGPPPTGGGFLGDWISGSGDVSVSVEEGSSGMTADERSSSSGSQSGSQSSTGSAYAVETQTIVNTDYGYRVPSIENLAQNERAQISLIDQQFAQFMAGQNLPNLSTFLTNELKMIDQGVYQLQVGFLNTLLMSPLAGVVTGLYKNPGDAVRPGEPVIRVEDNSKIFVVATLIYSGPIQIGSTLNIQTQLFDAAGPPTALSGSVIAIRNHDDDEQWDVVAQCTNPLDGGGKPTFPIGYTFDYDNTTFSIT